jgi:AAA+ ATPase superfamily predicted ATPase
MLFVDRQRELARLRRSFDGAPGAMVCVWGRRRLGKSRLVREAVSGRPHVWAVGDARGPPLHREAVAREMGRLVPGFDAVTYPSWDVLMERFWTDAPVGAVLVLDEFPEFVGPSPELAGVLQRLVDRGHGPHLALCGSSQRMMHGLVLDATAPLFGRAQEVLKVEPMAPRWLQQALSLGSAREVVERYAVFGGVPRYWELTVPFADTRSAVSDLVLDPLGVLHDEPSRLLLDDLAEVARAASILALVGAGASRLSEIAGRIGQPASSLTRPVGRLVDLGLIQRETPFGVPARDSKRTLYTVADPLLAFWYRFVDPNRGRLGAGALEAVAADVWSAFPQHLGQRWEGLARWRVSAAPIAGGSWGPATRWWGTGLDGSRLELDVVAERPDGRVLVGEAKLKVTRREVPRLIAALREKARCCPPLADREIVLTIWALDGPEAEGVIGPSAMLEPST